MTKGRIFPAFSVQLLCNSFCIGTLSVLWGVSLNLGIFATVRDKYTNSEVLCVILWRKNVQKRKNAENIGILCVL